VHEAGRSVRVPDAVGRATELTELTAVIVVYQPTMMTMMMMVVTLLSGLVTTLSLPVLLRARPLSIVVSDELRPVVACRQKR